MMAVGGEKKERRSKSLKTLDFIRAAFGACVSSSFLENRQQARSGAEGSRDPCQEDAEQRREGSFAAAVDREKVW